MGLLCTKPGAAFCKWGNLVAKKAIKSYDAKGQDGFLRVGAGKEPD
jgi:hypothetical protein